MRTKLHLTLLFLLVASTGALVVGCGGSDDSADAGGEGSSASSSASEPVAANSLSKAQYVKKANAICTRRREERIAALNKYREEHPTDQEEDEFVGSLQAVYVPKMKLEIADLRELGAPEGDEKRIEAMLASFEKWISEAEDLEGTETTPAFDKEVIRAGNLAGNYGLIECTYG